MSRIGAIAGRSARWAGVALGAALAALPVARAEATGCWLLMYERDGFKAYERRGEPPAYRAEGALSVGLAEVAAVLVDLPRQREWVSHLAESRLLEGDPLAHSVVYSRYDLPWPVRDRDAVIESVVTERPMEGEVHVRFRSTTTALAPERPECIRIPLCEGEFTLAQAAPDRVRVTYTIRLDPGGLLPAWLVRHFIRDAPADTLARFRSQVIRTRGQYDGFIEAQTSRWERERAREP
jgi:hypothetical protein